MADQKRQTHLYMPWMDNIRSSWGLAVGQPIVVGFHPWCGKKSLVHRYVSSLLVRDVADQPGEVVLRGQPKAGRAQRGASVGWGNGLDGCGSKTGTQNELPWLN